MKNLITELNSHKASTKSVGGQRQKTHSGTTAHAAAHHRTTLQVDSEKLAATAQKLAHGDVAREEKLVHWAEKHGLDGKVANAVLSRLERPRAKLAKQRAQTHEGGGKQQVEASHKAEEAAALKQKKEAEAKLRAHEAVKRQQAAAERKVASREHRYLASLSTHQRKLIRWAEANGLPQKLAENPADKAKVKKISVHRNC